MKITLYHGSTLSIEHPLAKVGRADLDFGNVCSISNSLIHSYILIRVFHWIQWTEKEVINEISPERALNLFYETNVCAMLHDSRYGLHLMSDTYIINDVLRELQDKQ